MPWFSNFLKFGLLFSISLLCSLISGWLSEFIFQHFYRTHFCFHRFNLYEVYTVRMLSFWLYPILVSWLQCFLWSLRRYQWYCVYSGMYELSAHCRLSVSSWFFSNCFLWSLSYEKLYLHTQKSLVECLILRMKDTLKRSLEVLNMWIHICCCWIWV